MKLYLYNLLSICFVLFFLFFSKTISYAGQCNLSASEACFWPSCPSGWAEDTNNGCGNAGNDSLFSGICCYQVGPTSPPPPTSCNSATGGYCSQGDFCTHVDYTYASSSYECPYSCCRPIQCSDLSDLNGACRIGQVCPNGQTDSYTDQAAQNSCPNNNQLCCTNEQNCNGGSQVTGSCVANPAPANSCGYFGGQQGTQLTTYVHPLCGQGNTQGNGYTCTPSSTCYRVAGGPVSCTPSPAFTDNCATNFTCVNQNTCVTTITAHVFVDYNWQGTQDGGDGNAPNIAVNDGGGNTIPTDNAGNAPFGLKTTGNYTFSAAVPTYFQASTPNPLSFTVGNNDGNKQVNFGITPLYQISGVVYFDADHNGYYSGSSVDPSYGRGTISITDGPTSVQPIQVAGDGTWGSPINLLAGTYRVTYTASLPTGWSFVSSNSYIVTVGNPAGTPSCNTGTNPNATCGGINGGSVGNVDIGVNEPYQISGNIYYDVNHNGYYNPGVDQVYGAGTVTVSGVGNFPVAADGSYTTGQQLAQGWYTVTYTFPSPAPSGWSYETLRAYYVYVGQVNCNTGGSPDASCGSPNGQSVNNLDFGVDEPYQISGTVFYDSNHDTHYNSPDPGYDGGTISISNVGNFPVAGNGTYTTGQILPQGWYTVTYLSSLPSGWRFVTPSSYTVYIGQFNCNPGGSPDGTCGAPNGQSVNNLNFGVDEPYQISGNVYNDLNKNGRDDAGEPGVGGGQVTITGPTNLGRVNVNGSGAYTSNQVLLPGTYTVQFTSSLPAGYQFQTSNNWVVSIGPKSCNKGSSLDASCGDPNSGGLPNSGSVNNLNFGLTNEVSWQQAVCFDLRNDSGTYTDAIPPNPSCGGITGAYNTITNASCTTGAGIVLTCNATPDFGSGTSNALGWQSGGAIGTQQECFTNQGLNIIRTSYDYLLTTARESNIVPIAMTTICSAGLTNCTLPSNLAKGIYQADGDVHLNAYTFPVTPNSPQAFIFLIHGNLYINGNILVPAGSVAAFSASGNIIVDKSVGNVVSDPSDPAVNNPNIEGLYSADSNFIINSYGTLNNYCNADGSPLDKKLNIVGSVITNAAKNGGSFTNNRDLCKYDPSCPTVIVGDGSGTSDQGLVTSYIMTLYEDGGFLNHRLFNWQELRP